MAALAGKNDSIDNSASVMSSAVPNVANVLKSESSSPSGPSNTIGTNSSIVGSMTAGD